jgi:putative protease
MAEEKLIGKITHYFSKIGVAVLALNDTLKVGETIRIKDSDRDFTQQVSSLQIEHEQVPEAIAGQSAGLKVDQKVHEGDEVYLVVE